MSFIFPELEAWDGILEVISFPACVGSRTVVCSITAEALRRCFACGALDALACFRLHRDEIEQEALRLICLDRFESDGSLLIRSTDLAHLALQQ